MREESLLIIPPKQVTCCVFRDSLSSSQSWTGNYWYVPVQFPFCIVWTPIPVISWLLPFVGHMGICTSKGITLDFAGPYFISVDNLAFGNPSRYVFKLHGFKIEIPQCLLQITPSEGFKGILILDHWKCLGKLDWIA